MAKFRTSIPVNVKGTRSILPPGSYFAGATYNPATDCVEIHWEHDLITGPYVGPVEYPLERLQAGEPPDKFRIVTPPKNELAAAVMTPKAQTIDKKPSGKAKVARA